MYLMVFEGGLGERDYTTWSLMISERLKVKVIKVEHLYMY